MKKTFSPCHNTGMAVHSRKPLRYRCKNCSRTYAARYGEISFGSKLKPQKILTLLAFLKKGYSIRRSARLSKLSPSTVERWKQRFIYKKHLHHECSSDSF